jgi:hypothetical protein
VLLLTLMLRRATVPAGLSVGHADRRRDRGTVGRDRPMFVNRVATGFGKSFPSGHAMNSTVVLGTLLAVLWWRRRQQLGFVSGASLRSDPAAPTMAATHAVRRFRPARRSVPLRHVRKRTTNEAPRPTVEPMRLSVAMMVA